MKARVSSVVGWTTCLHVPPDRFYMEENLAPAAEKTFREPTRTSEGNAYITVRIRDGSAVIENLWIDGAPIRELVARQPAAQ